MNFQHNDKFSSQWWVFIPMLNLHYTNQFSLTVMSVYPSITMMNFHSNEENSSQWLILITYLWSQWWFFLWKWKVYKNLIIDLHIAKQLSLLQPRQKLIPIVEKGWEWPSSALACIFKLPIYNLLQIFQQWGLNFCQFS